MKIKIVANNCNWKSWDKKIKQLKDWFLPKVDIQFDLVHTSFKNIPFIEYLNPTHKNFFGVDHNWYKDNITKNSIGYDMVLFVLPLTEWKGVNARGWRSGDEWGVIELQIGVNENESITLNMGKQEPAFFQLARHEIMHGMFILTGQTDTTHFYWDKNQLEIARDSLVFPPNFRFPMIAKSLRYIYQVLMNLIPQVEKLKPIGEVYPENLKSKLDDFALAIRDYEGKPGDLNYRNNNPGNIKGADGKFLKFDSYEQGFAYLKEYIKRASVGKHRAYKDGCTILEFFSVYAPSSDNNNPTKYAKYVANRIKEDVNARVKDFI